MDYIDDIAGRLTAAAIAFAVAGLAIAALSAAALGGVRASEKWPSAPTPRLGRPAVMTGALLGLVVFALAAGLFSLAQIGTGLNANLRVLLAVGIDLLALAVGLWLVSYVAGNIEMRTLIAVPDHPVSPPPIPVSGEPTRYQMPDYTETPMEPESQDYPPPHTAPEPRHPQSYQQAQSYQQSSQSFPQPLAAAVAVRSRHRRHRQSSGRAHEGPDHPHRHPPGLGLPGPRHRRLLRGRRPEPRRHQPPRPRRLHRRPHRLPRRPPRTRRLGRSHRVALGERRQDRIRVRALSPSAGPTGADDPKRTFRITEREAVACSC